MTEKERMDAGLIYDSTDREIVSGQNEDLRLLSEYNRLRNDQVGRMEELLRFSEDTGFLDVQKRLFTAYPAVSAALFHFPGLDVVPPFVPQGGDDPGADVRVLDGEH